MGGNPIAHGRRRCISAPGRCALLPALALASLLAGCADRPATATQPGFSWTVQKRDCSAPEIQAAGGYCYALLAGLDDYGSKHLGDLAFPEEDVRKMAAILAEEGYRIGILTGSSATRGNILALLDDLAGTVNTRDRVLFYWVGHGASKEGLGIKEGQANCGSRLRDDLADTFYILPRQTNPDCLSDYLSLKEVSTRMGSLPAFQQAMLIDACESGQGRSASPPPAGFSHALLADNGALLLTGWNRNVPQNLYSPAYREALKGAADAPGVGDGNGKVDAYELIRFVGMKVAGMHDAEGKGYELYAAFAGKGNFILSVPGKKL